MTSPCGVTWKAGSFPDIVMISLHPFSGKQKSKKCVFKKSSKKNLENTIDFHHWLSCLWPFPASTPTYRAVPFFKVSWLHVLSHYLSNFVWRSSSNLSFYWFHTVVGHLLSHWFYLRWPYQSDCFLCVTPVTVSIILMFLSYCLISYTIQWNTTVPRWQIMKILFGRLSFMVG